MVDEVHSVLMHGRVHDGRIHPPEGPGSGRTGHGTRRMHLSSAPRRGSKGLGAMQRERVRDTEDVHVRPGSCMPISARPVRGTSARPPSAVPWERESEREGSGSLPNERHERLLPASSRPQPRPNDRDEIPARPTTPCMNRGGGLRRRAGSAGASGRQAARGHVGSGGSVVDHMSELERALLCKTSGSPLQNTDMWASQESHPRSGRVSVLGEAPTTPGAQALTVQGDTPGPSGGRCTALGRPRPASSGRVSSLRGASRSSTYCQTAARTIPRETFRDATAGRHAQEHIPDRTCLDETAVVPRDNHSGRFGRGADSMVPSSQATRSQSSHSDSPARPRSPTPTKMLAWEEGSVDPEGAPDSGDSEHEGANRVDCLIEKLLTACQMNDISKVFHLYDRLHHLRAPLYEGVYMLIIECCTRNRQLDRAMQFYDTLKESGQRVSSRLAISLMEAFAKEKQGNHVHAIWKDWCSGVTQNPKHFEVLLVAVSALIRTVSPELASEVLADAAVRSRNIGGLAAGLVHFEVELEDLLQINDSTAREAAANGVLSESRSSGFQGLHKVIADLCQQRSKISPGLSQSVQNLLMEDVDLDLDLAAM